MAKSSELEMVWPVGRGWLVRGTARSRSSPTSEKLATSPSPRAEDTLPVRFLESKKNPTEFAEEVVMEAHRYNGFNMILVDLCSKTMIYVTNRPKDDEALVSELPPGIHVLSTASLDTPWPKASRLRSNFEKFLEKYGGGELPAEEMADKLMTDTTKADKTMLPSIYSVEFEYSLSSIFVEANTKQGCYRTRSISAISAKTGGEVSRGGKLERAHIELQDGPDRYQLSDFFPLLCRAHCFALCARDEANTKGVRFPNNVQ